MFSRMTDKTVFFEIFIEEDYDDDYDYDDEYDYDYDDEEDAKPTVPGMEKEKPNPRKWIDGLEQDEAVAGMLKDKVDDMIRKMTKMKV